MKDSCVSGREIAGGEFRRCENWSTDSMGFLSVCRSLLDKEGSWEGSDLCIFNAQEQSRSPD